MKQEKVFLTPEDRFQLALDNLEAATRLILRMAAQNRVGIISDRELQVIMKVSRRTLFEYRRDGILAFSVIKGRIYYEPGMLEDMLKRHRVVISIRKKRR